MKAERTMEQAIRDEAEELKFRRISEERAKMLWEVMWDDQKNT
jgi:hypothetical protein